MKTNILLFISFFLFSCSSISVQQEASLRFDTLFIAKVESKKSITLDPNESKSGRVLVGLVSTGPIGAIATAITEDDFSNPKAFEYTFSKNDNEVKVVLSRSITAIGSCVEVISPDDSKIEILRVVTPEQCE